MICGLLKDLFEDKYLDCTLSPIPETSLFVLIHSLRNPNKQNAAEDLLVRERNITPLQFSQLLRSPFHGSVIMSPVFQSLGACSVSQIFCNIWHRSPVVSSLQHFCAYVILPRCLRRFQLLDGFFELFYCKGACKNVNVLGLSQNAPSFC